MRQLANARNEAEIRVGICVLLDAVGSAVAVSIQVEVLFGTVSKSMSRSYVGRRNELDVVGIHREIQDGDFDRN
jgi:hypothetical protein